MRRMEEDTTNDSQRGTPRSENERGSLFDLLNNIDRLVEDLLD